MQGCTFNCKNCFNPDTHDFTKGEEFTDEVIAKVVNLCNSDNIAGLSILGGEPLHPINIEGTTKLAKIFKETYPSKNLWVWTGYLFDKYLLDKEVLSYIDVVVDGMYVDDLRDLKLKYKGSSNQRVIDVKKSLKTKKTIIYN